ncbi:MAG TPA: MFS transporter [Acidimicrobiia bacterium]
MRPFSRFSLAAITATAMGVATFGQSGFGVIASDLIGEFSIERWQIGALVSASGFTGALLSPMFGRVTDRLGSVKSVTGVLIVAMVAMAMISVSPSYIVLFGGAILTGLPNGWTNPATNALIVDNVAAGARGFITGIKQSGVQAGAFLGGLLLPAMSNLAGWRLAWASFLVFPIVALAAMWRRPEVRREPRASGAPRAPIPTAVKWIAVYGTLTGLGVSSTTTFLPLFAQEDQGWTKAQAGLLIAGVGLVGVIARITWGSVSERWLGHGRTLRLLAAQSTVGAIILALAASGNAPSWVLVLTALLFGSGAVAWNAVGMLAVMDYSVPESVGRGTGLAMLGFLGGIGLGAPLMGFSVDRLGVYTPGWLVLAGLFAMSTVVAVRIHRTGTLAHI